VTEPTIHEPGIHFGLDESIYHAHPALSASGIKNLMVSPLDFWARSWMAPEPEEYDSAAMKLGTAFHKRILEGREAFYAGYAAALEPSDYPTALKTNDELKAALQACGMKVSGNKADLIERLSAADPSALIWDRIFADHAERNAGRILLAKDTIAKIEIAAAMIEKHPQLSRCFSGGYPEVSIFWTDPETNVPMKSRLDYLKALAIVDLKTFSNPLMKPVDRAIAGAMASGKYHIQTAVYFQAVEHAVEHIKAGRVFGDVDKDWLVRFAAADHGKRQFVFVFQQTGVAPLARGKILNRGMVYECGVIAMRDAQAKFAECLERFGTEIWVDDGEITAFDDTEFPSYMVEA
jgi:hypothetical protein